MIVLEGNPNIKLGNTLYERYSEGTQEALEGIEQILELIKGGFIRNATLDGVCLVFLDRLHSDTSQNNSVTRTLQKDLDNYFENLFEAYDQFSSSDNYNYLFEELLG